MSVWPKAFQRVSEDNPVTPPPKEAIEWGNNVMSAALAGALARMTQEALKIRWEISQPPFRRASQAEQAFRLLRVSRKGTGGALLAGALMAVYSGLQLGLVQPPMLLSHPEATAGACAVTTFLCGGAFPGATMRLRALYASGGCLAGAALGWPLGVAQVALRDVVEQEGQAAASADDNKSKPVPDSTGPAIRLLEQQLNSRQK
ncbi:hypothetical protein CYMTET_24314 [Cymbomonas tetramitiformis]|uniref:Uncharacterized protein n=1 Tax=Cymbomonas tetramitiformis TaxID=36881 RepID=A0AAE0L0D1_9CHLO|nr:hypothetical protein CYMTET_24314 [Cymbomonas tetramitiformis]